MRSESVKRSKGSSSEHLYEVEVGIRVKAPNAARAIALVEDVARPLARRKVVVEVYVGLATKIA